MSRTLKAVATLIAISVAAGCVEGEADVQSDQEIVRGEEFPASLTPVGDGFPNAGDPCRRLNSSEAIEDWSNADRSLVGCPSEAAAFELGGELLGIVDGFFIVNSPESEGLEKNLENPGRANP